MNNYLPRADYLKLKAAMRALVSMAGGTRACHEINSRYRHQRYSDFGNPKHTEDFPPANVIADLEASCDQPVVTAALAELLGYVLVKTPEPGELVSFTKSLGRVARECGDVISKLGEALEDGKVTAGEAQRLRVEIREAQTVLAEIDCSLEGRIAETGGGGS